MARIEMLVGDAPFKASQVRHRPFELNRNAPRLKIVSDTGYPDRDCLHELHILLPDCKHLLCCLFGTGEYENPVHLCRDPCHRGV